MEKLVREVFDKLPAGEKKATAKLTVLPLAPANCDRTMLSSVYNNLLSNALKYTRSGEPAVIEVGCRRKAGEIIYYVNDKGVGFNMKYVDKLFQVFHRLHRAKEFEGIGIGLSIVQRIVHRHGGRIWAEGEIDKGTTIYFTIPQQQEIKNEGAN